MDRYEEALSRAEKAMLKCRTYSAETNLLIAAVLQEIFPELRESEDERIRKWIIDELHLHLQRSVGDKERCDELSGAIAWLKKQKEQKPRQYISEKYVFAIMSKLTNLSFSELIPIGSDEYKKIQEITSDVRRLLDYPIEQKPAEWSEEDKAFLQRTISVICWAGCCTAKYRIINAEGAAELQSWLEGFPNRLQLPKQEWGEEDEKMLSYIICAIRTYYTADPIKDKLIDWLRNRPFQISAQWDVEQQWCFEDVIALLIADGHEREANVLKTLFNQSKIGLSKEEIDNAIDDYNSGRKQEWSEEDMKEVIEFIENAVTNAICRDGFNFHFDKDYAEDLIKLLSGRFMSYWRPSEEQMGALHTVCYVPELEVYGGLTDWLKELYKQLKALM